jgi:competence protein ComEC
MRIVKYFFVSLVFIGVFSFSQINAYEKPDVLYTMVNVCGQDFQSESHIIKFSNGTVYAIDAGNAADAGGKKIVAYLTKNRIDKIDKYFITHAHKDHYGGLVDLLNSSIRIREIYLNVPEKTICDQEQPWGCDYSHFMKLLQQIKEKRIKIKSIHAGDRFKPTQTSELLVLFAHNGTDAPVGHTDINDTSIVMKLTNGTQSILFTGDLNKIAGDFLSKNSDELRADILKVPHHGTESTVTNLFFDTVQAKIALVPSQASLWGSERSRRIKEYFNDKNVRTYVSGVDGDVSLLIWKDKYRIIKK